MTRPPGYSLYEQVVLQWLVADHPLLLVAVIGSGMVYAASRSRAEFAGRRAPMGGVVAGLLLFPVVVVLLARARWPVVDAVIVGGLVFAAVLLVDMLAAAVRRLTGGGVTG